MSRLGKHLASFEAAPSYIPYERMVVTLISIIFIASITSHPCCTSIVIEC